MLISRTCPAVVLVILFAGCQGDVAVSPKSGSPPDSPVTNSAVDSRKSASTAATVHETAFEVEPDFLPLTFTDFASFTVDEKLPSPWQTSNDVLACSGKPRGYIYSLQPYQNFTWRLEYRFRRPEKLTDESKFKGNTGFLVYVTGDHKLWPVCLEVQGKHSQMAAIKENGGAQPVTVTDDDAARQMARKPVGEWNGLEIVSKDGEVTVSLNGTRISKSEPDFLSEGLIGIQAEDFPFEVRRMRIRRD